MSSLQSWEPENISTQPWASPQGYLPPPPQEELFHSVQGQGDNDVTTPQVVWLFSGTCNVHNACSSRATAIVYDCYLCALLQV